MLPRHALATAILLLTSFSTPLISNGQSAPRFAIDPENSGTAEQIAKTFDLFTPLERLHTLAASKENGSALQAMALNQHIILGVTAASLQLDATMGEIDAEIAETRELANYLTARRQRTIDLLNLASLGIGGSVGTASAALGLTEHARASGVLGVVAGSSITSLSLFGLRVRSSGREELEVPSNMLARIFDLPSDPNNIYPPAVARFMDTPAPNDPDNMTRRQRLIRTWIKVGRIPPPDTPNGRKKIIRIASRPGDNARLSIGDLDDRQAMLYDFRARLSFMKRDLAVLVEQVYALPAPDTQPHPEQSETMVAAHCRIPARETSYPVAYAPS